MARLPRLNLPGVPQHVVQRGNNRQVSFFYEQDYTVYLDKLKDYAKKYKVAVHAYVLMTNHVHLLMTPETDKGVSQLMLVICPWEVIVKNAELTIVDYSSTIFLIWH